MPRAINISARYKRRAQVAQLYLAGSTYREIADAIGVSHTTVKNDVNWLLDEWRKEGVAKVDEAMMRDVTRTDQLITALWHHAIAGNVEAIKMVQSIIDSRAKMIGYAGLPRKLFDMENDMPDEPGVNVNIHTGNGLLSSLSALSDLSEAEMALILGNLAIANSVKPPSNEDE